MNITQATRPLRDRVLEAAQGTSDMNGPAIQNFVDLLHRMLALDPERRITVKEAFRHPFILSPN